MTWPPEHGASDPAGPVTRATRASLALLISGAAALATGVALWKLWWWAGYPAGVFTPGLDGHGPDP